MNVEISVALGLLLGAVYILSRKALATSELRMVGGPMLLKWRHGIGRASVVDVNARILRLSSPVMRQAYAPPAPGSELLLKPLGGGPVRRAEFVAQGDAGWTVRLSA
ncbi:MAG: hypothetical protein ACYC96_09215 [Fimbriimonadaceae bacterium]